MTAQGFQTAVNTQPAPGVAGDFCSVNPRFSVDAGPGGLIAGPAGLTVGLFAWLASYPIDPNSAPIEANNFGSGPVSGFVGRNQQGLITQYLQASGLLIPAGFECVLYNGGDFWIKNNGTAYAAPGMVCYAAFGSGKASFAAASSAPTATSTSFSISAQTFSCTASINGDIMTVTAVSSGTLYPGSVLSSAAASAVIVSQLTSTETNGALGARGTYAISIPEQTVASTTITGTYGLLTLGGTITGTFPLGTSLSGTSVPTGATITANASNGASLTGVGGAGTYVTQTGTASSGTITGATAVATKWVAMSGGAVGELIKISDHLLG